MKLLQFTSVDVNSRIDEEVSDEERERELASIADAALLQLDIDRIINGFVGDDEVKDQEFSREGTRMVSAEPFGIACYQRVEVGEGRARYTHVGVVGTDDEAGRWLNGDPSVVPKVIFGPGGMLPEVTDES